MGYQKLVGVALVLGCVIAARTVAQDSSSDDREERGADASPAAGDPFATPSTDSRSPERDATEWHGIPIHSDAAVAAERRIERALDQPLRSPLDFVDTPLGNVMAILAEEYEIPIVFDALALEAVAQPPDAEVSISIEGVSLRSAIELALRNLEDLDYIIDREVLMITTRDEASTRMQTRVYAVADLLPRRGNRGGRPGATESGFTPIVRVITRTIEKESWAINGTGEGEICVVEPGMLVVTQSQRVHTHIDRLLATLRHVRESLPAGPMISSAERPGGGSDGF